jgi:hypothetical protein
MDKEYSKQHSAVSIHLPVGKKERGSPEIDAPGLLSSFAAEPLSSST